MIQALLYHDVVPEGCFASSGFLSPDANIYKFTIAEFALHLTSIKARHVKPAVSSFRALHEKDAFLLTFDDGGVGAIQWTADLIEAFGHIGHFFITTDYIGTPGFMSRAEIAELAHRGHIIGSHSCTHPALMSRCSASQLDREWRESVAKLSDILGVLVTVASIPGGSYSRVVASAAANAGIRVLFTSEPTSMISRLGECALIGRYSIQRGTSKETAAALADGDLLRRLQLSAYWNFKKILKLIGGNAWLEFRKAVLARKPSR
jgi:peptidoglycan/xylan/chitin deacetylase (PgdA/CDA1 family)